MLSGAPELQLPFLEEIARIAKSSIAPQSG